MWRLETLISLMIPKQEFELVLLGDVGILGLNTGKWSPEASGRGQRDERGVVGFGPHLNFSFHFQLH